MIQCSIVVPCYNEATRLNCDAFVAHLERSQNTSFLFVNDGSTDETLSLLRQLETRSSRIAVLNKERNGGKAEAVRQGLLHLLRSPLVGAEAPPSRMACVGFWDADLATPLDAIDDLVAILAARPGIDIVFGSRVQLLGRKIQRSATRHYLGRIFATCASVILKMPVYDTQCGAKIFRATAELAEVLQQPFCSRWIFDVELIARFMNVEGGGRSVGHRIYEFPLHCWNDVPGSKVRARDFVTAGKDLLTIRSNYLGRRASRTVAEVRARQAF